MRYLLLTLALVACSSVTPPRDVQVADAARIRAASFVSEAHSRVHPGASIEREVSSMSFFPRTATEPRVLARIVEGRDTVYWIADPQAGLSRYVHAGGDVAARGSFAYCAHDGPVTPDAAFSMFHDASYHCAAARDATPFAKVTNSSWVSCGGGCCNGARH